MESDTSELVHAFEKAAKEAVRNTADRIMNDLTRHAKDYVEEFYKEYDPTYYNRHFQLRKTPHKFRSKLMSTGEGFAMEAGVIVNNDDMLPLYDICRTEWGSGNNFWDGLDKVFRWTLEYGYHGKPDPKTPQFPSLKEKMDEYMESSSFEDSVQEWLEDYFIRACEKQGIVN